MSAPREAPAPTPRETVARERPHGGGHDRGATGLLEPAQVALHGRVVPHLGVHRRAQQHRHLGAEREERGGEHPAPVPLEDGALHWRWVRAELGRTAADAFDGWVVLREAQAGAAARWWLASSLRAAAVA